MFLEFQRRRRRRVHSGWNIFPHIPPKSPPAFWFWFLRIYLIVAVIFRAFHCFLFFSFLFPIFLLHVPFSVFLTSCISLSLTSVLITPNHIHPLVCPLKYLVEKKSVNTRSMYV